MRLTIILLTLSCSITIPACAQPATTQKTDIKVGGPCETVYECPVPFDQLNEVDTLPGFSDAGPKIGISGTVYTADGKIAAAVIIYIYHTDQAGICPRKETEKGGRLYTERNIVPGKNIPGYPAN